jgi:2,4-dienoyl-CoA reductase-like NADH-dependent reductase (Old Yellow Enzyme family)
MAEQMTRTADHEPDEHFEIAYQNWGSGGWGGIITGNVMIDGQYLGSPNDVVMSEDSEKHKQQWQNYAAAIQSNGSPGIVQLNHPGKQSPVGAGNKGFFDKNVAPSAIALDFGDGYIQRAVSALVFGTPREMTIQDIEQIVERFVATALSLHEAGFSGVELHAAHGYLLGISFHISNLERMR